MSFKRGGLTHSILYSAVIYIIGFLLPQPPTSQSLSIHFDLEIIDTSGPAGEGSNIKQSKNRATPLPSQVRRPIVPAPVTAIRVGRGAPPLPMPCPALCRRVRGAL
jgi:hypothetical protein